MSSCPTVVALFDALARCDAEAMAACYHPDAAYRSPVFGRIDRDRIGDMWRMVVTWSPRTTAIEHRDHDRVSWTIEERFGPTDRLVRVRVRSRLRVVDGLVFRHQDSFSFTRWAWQALGPATVLVSGLPVFRKRVVVLANAQLDRFVRGGG